MIEQYTTSNKNFIFASITSILVWGISLLTDQLAFAYFSAFLGTIISFFYLLKFFNGTLNPFKFLSIASVSLIFTTNISWLVSGIFVSFYYNIDLFLFLENFTNIYHESYFEATIFTLIFSLILFFFSLNKKITLKEKYILNKLQNVVKINNKIIYPILIAIITLEILLIYYGFIAYRTYAQENFQLGIIAPYISYLEYIFHFHIALTALLIFRCSKIKFSLKDFFLILFSLLLLTFLFFSRGRFISFFLYVELIFWYCLFNNGFPKLRTIFITLLILLPFIYNLTLFNDFVRYSNKFGTSTDQNLLSTFKNNFEIWRISKEQDFSTEKTTINLTRRLLLVHPLAKTMELEPSQKHYLLGKNILNNLVWTIPRIIYPGKVNFDGAKILMYKNFNLHFEDVTNSLYLFSYLDFWYFGLFLYPLLLFFYWKFLLFVMTMKDYNPLILIFILSRGLIFFFSLGEGSLLGYLSYARDTALLLLLLLPFTNNNFFRKSKKFS